MSSVQLFDVFLSHSSADSSLADLVAHELDQGGLGVFQHDVPQPGEDLSAEIRDSLAECSAVVFLLTPSFRESPNLAYEAGAAMAWNKPIFSLYSGVEPQSIPRFLREYRMVPISQLNSFPEMIRPTIEPFSDEDRSTLRDVYSEVGIPTDQLVRRPSLSGEISARFREKAGIVRGAERLVQELIKMRKRGDLPTVGRLTAAPE
ncbi:toll/interleukin-1 receptor domain-containing protein [Stratiformator vulcanicus]|uniref:TIR domain-containing protein n=1 Tax=Stratiformator vulcanicus TaxID=2527980 RepID=A0A517R6S0_9PLAN|nr:toll/interleukin-1 receptor domain-containing protein [Stratiformator vulcanicus]QDT39580.1 hypothetical protein Pan189_39890 [Stratiformator vulcanicus]